MATAAATTATLDHGTYRPPPRQRIDSIDLLRGLVMVIMMLDHTRDYFSAAEFQFDPTNLDKTSVALFLTRWITHYCAPTFFFLAGAGAYLRRARGATPAELSGFLVSRGVWLILLELTVVRVGISGDLLPHGRYVGQTIWALGWSMIALAALVHLPLVLIGAFGVAMVVLHNAFDGMHTTSCGLLLPRCSAGDLLQRVMHEPGWVALGHGGLLFRVRYPLVPWIGVMAAGYAFGKLYTLDEAERRRILLRLGASVILLFVTLRATNLYGDPSRWSVQRNGVFTALSFLNTTKYPSSLLYLCMTMGPGILLLAFLERDRRGAIGRALVTLGRVPMLFYLMQWLFAHGAALALYTAVGMPTDALHRLRDAPPAAVLAQSGFSLPVVYLFWILGVLTLYPICKWYAGVKARRREWWWGYL
ncbi:MAG TPA: heparan-alpha-glucosaminide N-acetyltransferase domain-containing protein [Gemmatimonadaceae bacterium]|jgi:uncharacterized membrane protein|nr:heparan-alpha-glucosaminide N-acetyltransferase domain-containing protein [Gemmatimonadaceae bacterium]